MFNQMAVLPPPKRRTLITRTSKCDTFPDIAIPLYPSCGQTNNNWNAFIMILF